MKPSQWSFDPRLVDARWRYLWDSIVLGLPLWEGGGDSVFDVSPYRKTGTLDSATGWSPTSRGIALDFPGTGDHYASWNTISFTSSEQWSAEFLYYGRTIGELFGPPILGTAAVANTFLIRLESVSADRFYNSDGQYAEINCDTGLSQFYHYVVTGDGANFAAWVDGEYKGQDSPSSGGTAFQFDRCGNAWSNDNYPPDGLLPLVIIYNRLLTNSEISNRAADPFGPFRPATRFWPGVSLVNADLQAAVDPPKAAAPVPITNHGIEQDHRPLFNQPEGDIRNGLVGEWRVDRVTGLVLPDTSGYGAHSAVFQSTWVTDEQYGPVLDFDNSNNDGIEMPDRAHLDIYGFEPITVEAFFKLRSDSTSGRKIVCKGYGGGSSTSQYVLQAYPDNGQFRFYGPGGSHSVNGNEVPLDEWHHMVGTYHAGVDDQRIYQNGEYINNNPVSVQIYQAEGYPLLIGNNGQPGGGLGPDSIRDFDGQIAFVRVYNRVLSAAEIARRYQLCLQRAWRVSG
jgi:hypothetical protein